MLNIIMKYIFLIFSLVKAFQYGYIPTHIIKNFNRGYSCAWIDSLNCMNIKGYISRCYTINKDAPLIQASIEKQQNENYKFVIKIHSNYIYNDNIECIIQTISEYGYSHFNIIELTDNTYFILTNKSLSFDELININNQTNTFVEFYNETHTGIRWHDHDKYYTYSTII